MQRGPRIGRLCSLLFLLFFSLSDATKPLLILLLDTHTSKQMSQMSQMSHYASCTPYRITCGPLPEPTVPIIPESRRVTALFVQKCHHYAGRLRLCSKALIMTSLTRPRLWIYKITKYCKLVTLSKRLTTAEESRQGVSLQPTGPVLRN